MMGNQKHCGMNSVVMARPCSFMNKVVRVNPVNIFLSGCESQARKKVIRGLFLWSLFLWYLGIVDPDFVGGGAFGLDA